MDHRPIFPYSIVIFHRRDPTKASVLVPGCGLCLHPIFISTQDEYCTFEDSRVQYRRIHSPLTADRQLQTDGPVLSTAKCGAMTVPPSCHGKLHRRRWMDRFVALSVAHMEIDRLGPAASFICFGRWPRWTGCHRLVPTARWLHAAAGQLDRHTHSAVPRFPYRCQLHNRQKGPFVVLPGTMPYEDNGMAHHTSSMASMFPVLVATCSIDQHGAGTVRARPRPRPRPRLRPETGQ